MKCLITQKKAGWLMIALLALLALFHALVMFHIIPPIVWGGQADDTEIVFIGELISLFVTFLFMAIVALKIGIFWPDRFRIPVTIGVWFMFLVFILSTIGNITSDITAEKLIFTPTSCILAFLAFTLGTAKE